MPPADFLLTLWLYAPCTLFNLVSLVLYAALLSYLLVQIQTTWTGIW